MKYFQCVFDKNSEINVRVIYTKESPNRVGFVKTLKTKVVFCRFCGVVFPSISKEQTETIFEHGREVHSIATSPMYIDVAMSESVLSKVIEAISTTESYTLMLDGADYNIKDVRKQSCLLSYSQADELYNSIMDRIE